MSSTHRHSRSTVEVCPTHTERQYRSDHGDWHYMFFKSWPLSNHWLLHPEHPRAKSQTPEGLLSEKGKLKLLLFNLSKSTSVCLFFFLEGKILNVFILMVITSHWPSASSQQCIQTTFVQLWCCCINKIPLNWVHMKIKTALDCQIRVSGDNFFFIWTWITLATISFYIRVN